MAQSLAGLPPETVFVETRAFVFFYQGQQNRWAEVGEASVYSRIQLLCSRQPGSTGLYRILGRLESSGAPTLNLPLTESVTYVVSHQSWHQIRVHGGFIYGLHFSPESNGQHFSIIVQNALRSLQGTRPPPVDHMGNWAPPPEPIPAGQNLPPAPPAATPRTPEPPSRDGVGAQKRRELFDAKIDATCASLSDAIRNGSQERAMELVKQLTVQKVPLSIKLKNPVLVTMDSGADGDSRADTINVRVVVEDKTSSGGAFTMKVSPSATIGRLQQEVCDRYSFPMQVQKWIVGKKIPKPTDTLHDLNVRQSGHTVFLYLLSGKTVGLRRSDAERHRRSNTAPTSSSSSSSVEARVPQASATASPTLLRRTTSTPTLSGQGESQASSAASRSERLPRVLDSPPASLPNQESLNGPSTVPPNFQPGMTIDQLRDLINQWGGQGNGQSVPNPPPQEAFVNNLVAAEQPAEEDGAPVGWECETCTFINPPTRPGCEMCSADRPQGYVVPDGAMLDERERIRIAAEERAEAEFRQDVERQLQMGLQQTRLQETE